MEQKVIGYIKIIDIQSKIYLSCEQQLFLEINKRQFKCDKCKKPFSEELNFVHSRRKYTKRLANQTIKEVLDSDIHTVAKKGGVTAEEIGRMLKDASKKSFSVKPSCLKRLGIDEIALVKGKGSYCADARRFRQF